MLAQVIKGALSGCLATAPMTAVMETAFRQLPRREQYPLPPRLITMRVADKVGIRSELDEEERTSLTLASHFGYGAAMGGILGAIAGRRGAGAVTGAVFGLGVWTGSYLGLLPAIGLMSPATEHPARRNALMIGAHLVWGSAAGLLLEGMQQAQSIQRT
jgi:hypothetical protein